MESGIRTKTSWGLILLRTLLPVGVLGVAMYGYATLKATKPKVPSLPKKETVWTVEVATVKIADHQPLLRLYGEATSGRSVELRSLVAGKIVETGQKLLNGGIVRKGDILLKIDPFKYEGALTEAKSRLTEAQGRLQEIQTTLAQEEKTIKYLSEQLTLAERDLKRASLLAKRGTGTEKLEDDRRVIVSQRRQSVEQRKSNLKVTKSKLKQQKAIIERLEWKVKEAKRNLKDTVLVSPFDAYVDAVNANVGRIVNANDRIATLFDQKLIDVQFTLSDSQYGRIIGSGEPITGRDVTILWRVSEPPLTYKAKIERVSSRIRSENGGVEVYARLVNPFSGTPIRPGTFVEVSVPDRKYKQVARLPQTVLFEGRYVYIVSDNRLKKRKVRSVGTDGNDILLTGNLKQGDKVLLTRISTVGEGVKVKPKSKNPKTKNKTTHVKAETSTSIAHKPDAGTGHQ